MQFPWDFHRLCVTDALWVSQNIWEKAGSDSISRERLAKQSALSTTRRCRRLAVIMAVGCFFLDSAQDLDRLLSGPITCFSLSWGTCLIATAVSLKIILASLVWHGSVKKPGSTTSSMPCSN